MMRALLIVTLFVLAPGARAQENFAAAGTAAALQGMGGSARALAMGGAYVGLADDSAAMFYNPAGLGTAKQAQVSLNHNSWLVDVVQEQVAGVVPFERAGGLGLAANYVNFGTFEGRDSQGALTSAYSGSRMGGSLGWGFPVLPSLSLGFAFNAFTQDLAGSAYTSSSADLGLLWEPLSGTRLGVASMNNGHPLGAGSTAAPVRVGASQWIGSKKGLGLILAASGAVESSGVDRYQVGTELRYGSSVAARAGYQLDSGAKVIDGLTGLSAGGGIQVGGIAVDYAWLPYGDLGSSQRMSLSYYFRSKAAAEGDAVPVTPKPAPTPEAAQAAAPSVAPEPATAAPAETNGTALKLKFRLPSEHETRALQLESQRDIPGAVTEMQKAIKENGQDASAWRVLGEIYQRAGKKAYAVQCFEQVQRLQPTAEFGAWLERYRAQ